MKRRRHTPEQVIRKLREAERLIGEGKTIPEAAKELGISEQTYHRWRNQYGGMKADDAKRLKELERENRQLKAIVADQALEVRALKEVAKGRMKVKPSPALGVVVASRRPCAGRRSRRVGRSGVRRHVVARG
jgi:putative transposase